MWKGKHQGFTETPHFPQVFIHDLDNLNFLCDWVLIQVDDLLKEQFFVVVQRTRKPVKKRFYLLTLEEKGHKVSKDKLQICQSINCYLGYDLAKEEKTLSED